MRHASLHLSLYVFKYIETDVVDRGKESGGGCSPAGWFGDFRFKFRLWDWLSWLIFSWFSSLPLGKYHCRKPN